MHVIEDLNDYLQSNPTMPSIYDPASTGRDFRERWDQDGCSNFRAQILHYATKMREAYDAETVNDSVAAWQDAFGPSFNKPAVEAAQKSLPAEQFIDTMLRIPIRLENRVTLFGRVRRAGVVRAYDLPRREDRVQKDRTIDFELRDLDVTGPYEVYWKVKNHGSEAVQAGQPRGDVIVGGDTRYESTAFVGSHYVEMYIVQNNVCVAKDRQPVIIQPR